MPAPSGSSRCRAASGSSARAGACPARAPRRRRCCARYLRCCASVQRVEIVGARGCSDRPRSESRRCRRPDPGSRPPASASSRATMQSISGRGVKYWPAPDFFSFAFFSSRPSYRSPRPSWRALYQSSLSISATSVDRVAGFLMKRAGVGEDRLHQRRAVAAEVKERDLVELEPLGRGLRSRGRPSDSPSGADPPCRSPSPS